MKVGVLLRHNIDTLLKARGQTRHDLAFSCGRSDAWLSKILSEKPSDQARGLPVKYLDKIADFFGIATYQLFQPGISPLTERRSGRERRTGRDRRVSNAQRDLLPPHTADMETVTPWERSILKRLRKVTNAEDRKELERLIDLAARAAMAPRTR